MKNQLCLFTYFLLIIFWSYVNASAVDVERSIPDEVLSHFSILEIGRNVIGLSENHLTAEEFERIHNNSSLSLPELFLAKIAEGDKESLWNMCKSVNKTTIRKIIEGSIDRIPVISSELNKVVGKEIGDVRAVSLLLNLVEGKTIFPTLVMNLQIHAYLADLSSRGNPIAQWYMAKLLKFFSIKQGDELDLASQNLVVNARKVFERLLKEETSFSLKGLYSEYLGNETEAFKFYQVGVERGEAIAHYKIAQKRESLGENDALDYYERSFILGYENALYDIGRLHTDDNSAFLILKKAGERGNSEAYSLIAQMIREGFVPLSGEETWNTQEFWLLKGANLGASSCILSFGALSEKQGNLDKSMFAYRQLADLGNIRGYLEQGKILEKKRRYIECEEIYKNQNAGWFGLYALAEITSNKEEKKAYKRQASEMFHSHFRNIIEIATTGL